MIKQILILIVGVAVSVPFASAQKRHASSSALVNRGKYLVESIGACADCHTPMNEKGEPIKDQWLQGATLMFKPTVPVPDWADRSANIAGLPGWEKEAAMKFFMSGVAPNGVQARPPMPQLRYNRADAEAIVAYLKSLKH